MSYRTTLPDHGEYAVNQLRENYDFLKENFFQFFEEICEMVEKEDGISL
jgi:hypothetical protein